MMPEMYEKMYLSEENNWWYRGRRELIIDILAGFYRTSSNVIPKILDVGCGTGLNSCLFGNFGEVIGLDISNEALRFSKSRGNIYLIRSSADYLPFKDNSLDIICALDLLEHIYDDFRTISEFNRILKPGGFLILTVPAFMFLWSGHDEVLHHMRRYEKPFLEKLLYSFDFSLIKTTYWNFILFPGVAVMRLYNKKIKKLSSNNDLTNPPKILNNFLYYILHLENLLIRSGINLPFGVSIICVCEKRV